MRTILLTLTAALVLPQVSPAVDLVDNGRPVAEIILAPTATPGVRVAAEELQRHVQEMSGAVLPIVDRVSILAKNHVYIGESRFTAQLGVTLDDVAHDGFKIVARGNSLVLAGHDVYHSAQSFRRFQDVSQGQRQRAWEEYSGTRWRQPAFYDYRDFQKTCGFHLFDGTGTLYAVYELLEQFGVRWYMPIRDLGVVIPRRATLRVADQNLKREPEFSQRMFCDPCRLHRDDFLWYKSLRVGTSFPMPHYHSIGRLLEMYPDQQPQEYYGVVNGKIDYAVPRLTSPRLRTDFLKYLELVEQTYPGLKYACIGQPDGWSTLDDRDVAAGWDKFAERGPRGRFTDYAWDFILDARQRYLALHPEKLFTVYAYGCCKLPPSRIDKIPGNLAVVFCQTSPHWMQPEQAEDLVIREQWRKKLDRPEQLLVYDYYLEHAPIRNFPPVPVVFTQFLRRNFASLYDRCAGYTVELPWLAGNEYRPDTKTTLRRPGLSHLMLYLHSRLAWDRNLDLQAVLDEYYDLYFGPAKAEMSEFHEFAEQVWTRPEPRQITAAGGFLKPADVDRYFDLLRRARLKAGDTIYGRRIDFLAAEMTPLKALFEKLKRIGPVVHGFEAQGNPPIDGDLDKPFWRARAYSFHPLRDMVTGELPSHVAANVSFRWHDEKQAIRVAIECLEPRMDRLHAGCSDRDSSAIFADDNVEIRLETPQGARPWIVVNPRGAVYDECVTANVADLPSFYKVQPVAVKKYADRWTVELQIDAAPIAGQRPTEYLPWGVNVCRQRMAGNRLEHYMLSPSGTRFNDLRSMSNLIIRR
jgi:hypothetical protein